ncbi:MAG: hypothetical protein KIS92_00330 [Planctomycetota bacterium]|nr:hypothetical protein [Planctomycetota bacterium]
MDGTVIVGLVVVGIVIVALVMRSASQKPPSPEEQLRELIGPRGMEKRDRNRAAHQASLLQAQFHSGASSPSQKPQPILDPELKPYLTRLCKIQATTGGLGDPEVQEIGKELNEKFGNPGMVAVCDELRSVMGPAVARDLEYKWNGIGEWRG